ncbi:DNA repair protein RecN [Quadrisphaera sp. DSM 44207]|uniref:DNA repair protein RecN n=1 Tax=Quadrisphaera sp. DSM 44207 TaxID=1881057 RepID=UPI000888F90D|nr:DNA repair protein RecN [Quadrisphaera sp. DSM 44207]SDQ51191.1 DNA replication and repair protein RecN [Quadrisphaera sp. DSM 44207]
MLEEVRIRSLGVITDATLELGPGLTVITGETGAGKTMVVTGLGLLLGSRADPGAVRTGADQAVVEGRFSVPVDGPVAARAAEAGAELDEGDLLVARTVAASGRGRTHVGGRAVPVGLLSELADDLVAVHGQSEQVLLRSPARQRQALDRYAGSDVADPTRDYTAAWRRWQLVQREVTEITQAARERAAEAELLRRGLAEVERTEPQPGEDRALAAEAQRLEHAEELRAAAASAHEALAGEPATGTEAVDATSVLDAARRALEHVRSHDEALGALADRLAEVGYLVADVAADLAGYAESVEGDPLRLGAVQERRAELAALARAHGGDVDAVLAWAEAAVPRLLELEGDDERVEALRAERDELAARLVQLAGALSAARRAAAAELGAAATAELPGLAMPHAQLLVQVDTAGGADGPAVEDLGPSGADEVVLLLAPSSGTAPRPLARGASGGELSRVMLALELVLAGTDPVPTFVFDEVDAGVGGRAAVGIGRRLARLARERQVLVVTHLPQVAAYADHHLQVAKASDGQVTVSGVRALDDAQRVAELARMLAGQEESGSARAHAEELLLGARAEVASPEAAPERATMQPR